MKIVRNVALHVALLPTRDALLAEFHTLGHVADAARTLDNVQSFIDAHPFAQWLKAASDRTHPLYVGHLLSDRPVLAPEPAVEALLAAAPTEGLAAQAWRGEIEAALDRARTDEVRRYDLVLPETDDERTMVATVHNLSDTLRAASPLLASVAEVVDEQAEPMSMGLLLDARARITETGINVGAAFAPTVVPWDHISALSVPTFEDDLRAALLILDQTLPVVADDDTLDARCHDDHA